MCTVEKRGSVYILTLTRNDDHRLNPTLIDSVSAALRRIRSESTTTPAAALVTTAEGKFFSNGYDLEWAQSDKECFLLKSSKFKSLITDLISLPMPKKCHDAPLFWQRVKKKAVLILSKLHRNLHIGIVGVELMFL